MISPVKPALRSPILAIDTAYPPLSVALLMVDGRIDERLSSARAGAILHDLVRDILASAGLEVADLGGLAVLRGPGSFTGLRVGLASASGLALATGLPVLGIETTRALALASGRLGRVAVLVEAGKGRVFVGLHEVSMNSAAPLLPEPLDSTIDEALLLIAGADAAILRGAPPEASRLLAAGCVPLEGGAAGAAARLALGAASDPDSLQALYARQPAVSPPAIRAPGAR